MLWCDSATGTPQPVTSTTPSPVTSSATAHTTLGTIIVYTCVDVIVHVCVTLFCFNFLDVDDLFTVYAELIEVAHKWKGIGLALRLSPNLLDKIHHKNYVDIENYLQDVLTEWLRKAYNTARFGGPSWKLLVEAVAHPAGGNDCALADKIAKTMVSIVCVLMCYCVCVHSITFLFTSFLFSPLTVPTCPSVSPPLPLPIPLSPSTPTTCS